MTAAAQIDLPLADVLFGAAPYALIHGDCLDPVTGLASLPNGSVQHCITDPPYDEHTHTRSRRGSTGFREKKSSRRAEVSRSRDLGFAWLTSEQQESIADACADKVARWSLAFCTVEMVHGWRGAFMSAGSEYVRTAAWRKIGCTPQFTGDRPAMAFETVVIAHRTGERKRWNGHVKHGWYDVVDDTADLTYEHLIVLERGNSEVRLHTTQKPLALMLELVSDFTDPGDIVIDPFMGSGTTGVACLRLGRRFIGWEKDANYYEIACRRLRGDEAKPNPAQPSLFGPTEAA